MSKQQDWLAALHAGEIHLQVITEFLGTVEFAVSSQCLKSTSQELAKPIDGRFVIAWRFGFDQLPYCIDDLILPGLK